MGGSAHPAVASHRRLSAEIVAEMIDRCPQAWLACSDWHSSAASDRHSRGLRLAELDDRHHTMMSPIAAMMSAPSHNGTTQLPHVTPLTNWAPAGPTSMNAKIVRRTRSTA